jgi:hypothetical protein
VSATPEQIADELEDVARISKFCVSPEGGRIPTYPLTQAAALIRAQADALKRIAEMDGDQPARSDWDMVRIARAALKAAP